ncbi:hypothetical protein EYF80_047375 [Liparis tanakae]|uniref:Uncharacterized protein n=1 Tax=Liparis tanakae TaxID=230148 RepID=A0A4Z2FN34_9TELE|nr:hypothetical protein EYF80_047375 [Liparis tanakae]
MVTRNAVLLLLLSLFLLLVEGDLDSKDKDSTSDEAPTEDESSNSEEGRILKLRTAKAQSPAFPPQPPAHIVTNQSPAVVSQPIIPQVKALVSDDNIFPLCSSPRVPEP